MKLSRLYKRLSAAFFIFLAVAAMLAIGLAVVWMIEKPSVKVVRQVVKELKFQSTADLNELENKLLGGNWTSYSLAEKDGRSCIWAVSEGSASTLIYERELLHERKPFVSWYWKAEKFPLRQEEEVINKKKEFDFVAQFYVVFTSRFFLNAKAIQYVWTETLPVGTVENSPYTNNVKVFVLESGPSKEWKYEERDIRKDFKDLFGEELEKNVAAVAFMTDSDSTGSSAEAYLGDITLGYLGKDRYMSKVKEKGKKWIRSKRFPFLKEYVD